jgi:hypothetical protein
MSTETYFLAEAFFCFGHAQSLVGRPTDFFLFGCILETNMIDKRLGDKPVKFELSIGNHLQDIHTISL